MSIKSEVANAKENLIKSRKAILARGGEIATDAGFKDLSSAILNIPPDFALSFIEDDGVAYQKTAPENSLPYAQIKKIGGMTYKSKNLVPFPYVNKSKTEAGITWTVNDDGSVSVSGTATANSIFYLYDAKKFPLGISKGTTVIVSAGRGASTFDTSVTFMANYHREDGDIWQGVASASYGNGNTWTVPENAIGLQLYLIVISGRTVNHTVYPQIELGTVATEYEPYFEGLRHAAVEEVKSEGKNIFNIQDEHSLDGVDCYLYEYQLKPNTKYTVSSDVPYTEPACVYANGTSSYTNGVSIGVPRTVTTDSNGYMYLSLRFKAASAGNSFDLYSKLLEETYYLQIEEGQTATDYKPYVGTLDTFAIPQAVKEIDGYGDGINEKVCNYVDFVNKQFGNMLGRIYEPKVSSVGKHENSQLYAIVNSISEKKAKANGAIISTNYNSTSWSDEDKMVYSIGDNIIINDSRFSSIEEAQSILNQEKTIIYYELKTPEFTDISALLAENNFIKVEGGGTLTFENEYGYAVPSTVKYVLEVG